MTTKLQKLQWLLNHGAVLIFSGNPDWAGPLDIECFGIIDCKECIIKKECMLKSDCTREKDFLFKTIKKYPLLPYCVKIEKQ